MAKIENTMECIEELMDKMLAKGISKLSYSNQDFEIILETPTAQSVCVPTAAVPVTQAAAVTAQPTVCGKIIKSPIVGTYYNAPAPDKDPFVTVGQKVKKGDILMIIELMKLMNEITSDYDGTIAEIMVSTGTAVEFDQPLMRIE